MSKTARNGHQEVTHDWSALEGFEGFQDQMKTLKAMSRLPHVILLEGETGIGKRLLAAFMAALYYCKDFKACGQCDSCREVMQGRHPDLLWVETGKSSLKLEDAVSIQEHLYYKPGLGLSVSETARVAVILDCDKLNRQAVNRLLKTLEEPPESARLILTTSRYYSLLPTLRSRLVRWHLRLPAAQSAVAYLQVSDDERQALLELLDIDDFSEIFKASQKLAKQLGLTAGDIAMKAEIVVNEIYKNQLTQESWALSFGAVIQRREVLRELKRLGHRQKIALNTTLSAESIALANI